MTNYNLDELAIQDLKDRVYKLEKENTKLKLTLTDYGIKEDEVSEITDSEAICIKQLEKLRQVSDEESLSEEEAKIFKIFNEQLLRLRGGKLERNKKTPPGKQLSEEELLEKANVFRLNK